MFLRQVKLCIGQQKYKQKFTAQGRKDRPTDRSTDRPAKQVNSRSLTQLLFRILQNSCKNATLELTEEESKS